MDFRHHSLSLYFCYECLLFAYIIIELARKYNRRVRYFAYASATKCAEQVVAEEENTDK